MQFSVPRSLAITISLLFVSLLAACGGEDDSKSPQLQNIPFMAGAPSNSVQQFPGVRDAYTIQKNSNGYLVTEIAGNSAAVPVTAQATLRFLNVSVNLLMGEKIKQISPKDLNSIIELYIAFFNRVPDADGLCYWIDRFNAGMSLDQMSENFYQAAILFSKETGYTATMSDAEFVKIIYKNVLGREGSLAPPSEDVAYWVGELTSGRSSKGRLISTMLNSAHTFAGDATWGWVPRFLDNKITVATLFSAELGLNYLTPEESIAKGMEIVRKVTEASISDAIKVIPMADVVFSLRGQLPVESTLMGGAIQKGALNLKFSTTTFAGSVPWADGDAITARLNSPSGIVIDGTNLYIADEFNDTVRKMNISTGVVTTLAGFGNPLTSFGFPKVTNPNGLVLIGDNLFVSDQQSVRKVSISSGQVSVIASTDRFGTGGANSRFLWLAGIATDQTKLYVVDKIDHTIKQIVIATGVVTTLAGTSMVQGSADGIGTAASFNTPSGICSDGANLYVADTENSSIRQIVIATGRVTTLAGRAGNIGSADGIGGGASFAKPKGITCSSGKLYVSDIRNANIRQIDLTNAKVSTLAGTGLEGHKDGLAATFYNPSGMVSDGVSLYVADTGNNLIRKITQATGETGTLIGRTPYAEGVREAASITRSQGVTTDGTNLYVADYLHNNIRKIAIATGAVSILVGARSRGGLFGSKMNFPSKITTDGKKLFVPTDHFIRQIVISTGENTILAGSSVKGSNDGIGTAARFQYPKGITTDGSYVYVADTQNHTIRKIEIVTGKVTTLAGKVGVYGTSDGVGENALFYFPSNLTTDGSNLYVISGSLIRKIVIATGQVTTPAGYGRDILVIEGIGAWLGKVHDITCDGKNLYLTADDRVLRIEIATAKVSIIAGWRGLPFLRYQDGVGGAAAFQDPQGITTDGRSLFVVDSRNDLIRKIN